MRDNRRRERVRDCAGRSRRQRRRGLGARRGRRCARRGAAPRGRRARRPGRSSRARTGDRERNRRYSVCTVRSAISPACAITPAFEIGAPLRRVDRAGVQLGLATACSDSGRAAARISAKAPGAPLRISESGSSPAGSAAKRRLRPGANSGSARASARSGGALSGGVAVEAQHRLGRETPQFVQLHFGQRGAERRDGAAEPGAVQRDHVHIAFDDDDRRARRSARARHWRAPLPSRRGFVPFRKPACRANSGISAGRRRACARQRR